MSTDKIDISVKGVIHQKAPVCKDKRCDKRKCFALIWGDKKCYALSELVPGKEELCPFYKVDDEFRTVEGPSPIREEHAASIINGLEPERGKAIAIINSIDELKNLSGDRYYDIEDYITNVIKGVA